MPPKKRVNIGQRNPAAKRTKATRAKQRELRLQQMKGSLKLFTMQPAKVEVQSESSTDEPTEKDPLENLCALSSEFHDHSSSVSASRLISAGAPDHYCNLADQMECRTGQCSTTSHPENMTPECLTNIVSNTSTSNENELKNEHTEEKPYVCKICKMRFSVKLLSDIHKMLHTGERSHECNVCKQSFPEKASLLRHTRIHSEEKPFECATCKKCFSSRTTCDRHMRLHIGAKTL